MSKPVISLAIVLTLTFAGSAAAQYYNPGHSYGNPDTHTTAEAKRKGPCGDPWVTLALNAVHGRADPSKCNVALYNGGQWSNFNQLVHAVAKQKGASGGTAAVPTLTLTDTYHKCSASSNQCEIFSKEKTKVGVLINGNFTPEVPPMVAAGGGNLVGNDGAGMVAAGGGNAVVKMIREKVEISNVTPLSGRGILGVSNFRALKEKTRQK